ncbi:YidC/Oxa1 family membrane protein insertase, partial [Candidatus Hakubella thermalkaliphila]
REEGTFLDAILKPIVDLLQFILQFYYDNVFPNYGIGIILLTITVRVVLLPLTITQTKSMIEMQKVQPKLKALQEKYKKDKERLQKEMLAFYQEHKIYPLAGCFPLLLFLITLLPPAVLTLARKP